MDFLTKVWAKEAPTPIDIETPTDTKAKPPTPPVVAIDSQDVQDANRSNDQTPSNESKDWGYDLYPERRGVTFKPKWTRILFGMEGQENIDRYKCEQNVYWCVKNGPLVKLMMGALKSSGCPIDLRRHISCEVCDPSVTGGYDPKLNQIVVCQNMAKNKSMVHGVLTHEMIHMFDYCNNDLDFRNVDHLACTEIRAANLAHCSFLSAMFQGDASPFNVKEAHQNCVKTKALASVLAVRNISKSDAIAAVERVFPKCYADLEPIGRRIRRNSTDQQKAYMEGPMYGYDVY
ncbi:mitochondrial inner membrane protease ATP23 homolog [Drosophila pseudoobscura]|uniref:Mitochondrial inner membrane protease ATP23 n=1 Tax=Drosophila pseudoobscura pseudoobscura TaxID=46245 RepID=A0A6I8VYI1_DROPS|nr:mitochondrial inner membrane protease ATP23 homolog [Drosophila pseudoobscura]XP_033236048.1 mitochondrial inner membrane protease ATP23 homolog [Drosophila pseudoobscura]